ncbi:restriction endonuclease [Helicobacter valdiviensis]|uniref:Restriction endonuclease n=1 Tax=Helicobacter valdiviensis TaxID=1458358 RepID=A0A2W6MVD2_9HELI|nr:McrC family protein [Helicobacter valdiviensis]PZT48377.1 restriction endonuclease [Helicobacter valdiviensis]
MNNTFSIIEYQAFNADNLIEAFLKDKDENQENLKENLEQKAIKFYKELEDFAKNNESLLGFKNKNTLKAKNYVGIIQTKSGVLEILPKCTDLESYIEEKETANFSLEELKKAYRIDDKKELFYDFKYEENFKFNPKNLLINMLKTLKDSPFKKSQISSLQISKMPLFEVFIVMFLDEFDSVYSKGLKRDYINIEENRTFLKGKLQFSQHLKQNLIHKERFFTSSDEFVLDIAPNRLIKSTLNFLKSKTLSNKFRIIKALQMLDEVKFSTNYTKDFSFKISRHFSYYENLLLWCKVFLQNQTFTSFQGKNEAFALLFPMEKLFESYVADMLKKVNFNENIKAQSREKYLLQKNNQDCFMLKPDLIINKENFIIIADTKWKILHKSEDISQSDLYQMFAYASKYKAKEVWLIYPLFKLDNSLKVEEYQFKAEILKDCNRVQLKILFAPLPF